MERTIKTEEIEVKKEEIATTNLDVKLSNDSKNVQSRIVRGTKKMRIDSTESSQVSDQKKG